MDTVTLPTVPQDPNTPLVQPPATVTPAPLQDAPPVQPSAIATGHPEAPVVVPSREMTALATEVAQRAESAAQLEVTNQLQLEKEILPGLTEKHHQSEAITLPSQVLDAGVSSHPLPMGVNTYKADDLVLPLTQTQVEEGLRHPVKDSWRWLSEWCVKQYKEAHLMVKRRREPEIAS